MSMCKLACVCAKACVCERACVCVCMFICKRVCVCMCENLHVHVQGRICMCVEEVCWRKSEMDVRSLKPGITGVCEPSFNPIFPSFFNMR